MDAHDKKQDIRLPAIDALKCNRCATCIEACPREAILSPLNTSCAKCVKYCITMQVPCAPEHIIFNYDRCDSCGLCVSACPKEAIYWITQDRPAECENTTDAADEGARAGAGRGA